MGAASGPSATLVAPTPPPETAPAPTLGSIVLGRPRLLSPAVGVLFWWSALVPSLLPRSAFLQGVIGGVSFTVGWAVGSLFGVVWDRATRTRPPERLLRALPVLRRVVIVAAFVAAVVGTVLWLRWQNQQREVVGPHEVLGITDAVVLWVVTLVIAVAFLGLGRLYAFVTKRIDHEMPARMPGLLRHLLSGVGVAAIALGLLWAVVALVLVPFANAKFGEADATAAPGLPPPQAPTVTGGQGSLVSWSTLGNEGQFFTATATSTDSLRALRPDVPVKAPVRVHVGLRSADDAQARAALAVKDLERAGGFDRKVLVVWTSTGTGWVDPVGAAAIEYLGAGDTAIVSQQYSFLPSWISFLVDKDKASDAGQALFRAVHERWAQLPPGNRPKLVAFGESLGSFGSEATFARATEMGTLDAAATEPDAALFVGPTNENVVWNALLATRQPGTPVWQPVSALGPKAQLADGAAAMTGGGVAPKVLWVQHASDPVGWWSWSTLWSRPGWMQQPTGDDVPKEPSWFPAVSFLQATFDLMNGFSSSPGHGHNYDPDFASAWAAVTAPDGWTTTDTDRLAHALLSVSQS